MSSEWGAVCRPKQGQSVSGDVYVVHTLNETQLLVSVIDGLGGGHEAARAADGAAQVLRSVPDLPLSELIRRAHVALHQTRGAVIGLLRLDLSQREADFVGVGNIGVQVYNQQPIKPISKNGILGYRLPALLQLHYTYNSGAMFVLYSDGISSRFSLDDSINLEQSPQTIANNILENYGKFTDDATVVVVRCP